MLKIQHLGITAPQAIIEKALSFRTQFDEIYCVIDNDNDGENFQAALKKASQSANVKVIASAPCFEIWLLLHAVGFTREKYDSKSGHRPVLDALRKQPNMKNYDKCEDRNLFNLLLGQLADARQTSTLMLAHALNCRDANGERMLTTSQAQLDMLKQNGVLTPCLEGRMNPSSQLHLLMDVFETLSTRNKQPQPLCPK